MYDSITRSIAKNDNTVFRTDTEAKSKGRNFKRRRNAL